MEGFMLLRARYLVVFLVAVVVVGCTSVLGDFSVATGGDVDSGAADAGQDALGLPDTSLPPDDGGTDGLAPDSGADAGTFTLSVTKTGRGSVTSLPIGLACGTTCDAQFPAGATVTLTATASAGSIFQGWSGGGCSGFGTCVVTMTAATTVTAPFRAVVENTWDPGWSVAGATYTAGNLSVSGSSAGVKNVRSILGKSAGKWYWEITATGGDGVNNGGGLGIAEQAMPNTAAFVGAASSFGFGYACCATQYFATWTGVTANGAPPATSAIKTGNVYMFALDMDTGRFWAGNDGVWYGAGDPAGGTAPVATGLTGTVYPAATFYANSINALTANFGASAFKFKVPAGFRPGLYGLPTTWDPAWSVPGVTYSPDNLSISGNSATIKDTRTLVGAKLGKYYWELKATGGDGVVNGGGVGILEAAMPANGGYIGQVASGLSYGYACCETQYFMTWAGVTLAGTPPAGSAVRSGTVYMFALDMNTGRFWTGHNGTWYNAGNPGANLNPVAVGITGTVYPGVTLYATSPNAFTANFGASAFVYPVPNGFGGGFY
jgi:hypothetical protein